MTTLVERAEIGFGNLAEKYPSQVKPLATPPPGSGLKPVMGDYGAPIIGHTLGSLGDLLSYVRKRYQRYGAVSWSGTLGTKMVGAFGPDAIEAIAMNRDKAFGNEGFYTYLIGAFFRRGVMLMDFGEHLHHRRIMQQAFTKDRLVGYLNAMNPRIAAELDRWRPSDRFEMYTATKQLTLDVATDVFVGDKSGAGPQINRAFVDAVHGGQAIIRADVPGGVWHKGLRGRRLLEDYFREQLPAKRASEGDDLFSVLCHARSDEGETYTDEDVVNHMIFVLMAAHDTSTITLAMMAYYLGKYPQWQDRIREESLALGKDMIDYDDLDRLVAMDLVMKETLRINAPVGGLFRETVKDTELLGHYIPAKTRLFTSIYAAQRMEPWWPNPDTFDPERFAEHRREDKVHRFAWAPFGGGAHKCIGMYFGGMEVKAVLHQLVQRYRWTVPDDYVPWLRYGTGPAPTDGLPIDMRALRSVTAS